MSRKEKPLPSPPSPGSRFKEEDRASAPLMADQMAMAAAAGKIEQFMEEALPDNEHARKLAAMMMGMSGMMPPVQAEASPAAGQDRPRNQTQDQTSPGAADERNPENPDAPPLDEVYEAVRNADVKGLMGLLRQEHSKRSGDSATGTETGPQQQPPQQPSPASIEKMLLERVMAIAFEHDLTPDWVVMRALKLYVEGYEKTGRL